MRDLRLLDLCQDLVLEADLLRDVEEELEPELDEEEDRDLPRLLEFRPEWVRLGDLERCLHHIVMMYDISIST